MGCALSSSVNDCFNPQNDATRNACIGVGVAAAAALVTGGILAAPAIGSAASALAPLITKEAVIRIGVGCALGLGVNEMASSSRTSGASKIGSCVGGSATMFGGQGATLAGRMASGLRYGLAGGALDAGITQGGNWVASGGSCKVSGDMAAYSVLSSGLAGSLGGMMGMSTGVAQTVPYYGQVLYDGIISGRTGIPMVPADHAVEQAAGSCAR
jgi:hypothetical protein